MKHKLLALVLAGAVFAACNKDNDVMPPNGGGTNPAMLSVPGSLSFSEAGRSASPVVYTYGYENGKPKSVTVTQNGTTISKVAFTYNQNNTLSGLTYTDANNSANSYTEAFAKNGNTLTVTKNGTLYSTLTLDSENFVTTEALNGGATNTYSYLGGNHTGVTGGIEGSISGYTGKGYFSNMSLEPYEEFLMAEYLRKDARAKTLAQNPQEKTFSDNYEMTAAYTLNANGMPQAATTTIIQNGTTTTSTVTTEYKEIEKPKPPATGAMLPKTITFSGDDFKNVATIKYDDDNRIIQIEIGDGRITNIYYYPNGDLKQISSVSEPDNNYDYSYEYDSDYMRSYRTGLPHNTIYEYFLENGYITKRNHYSGNYDDFDYRNGNVITIKGTNTNSFYNSTAEYTYDDMNNIFAGVKANTQAQAYIIILEFYNNLIFGVNNIETEIFTCCDGADDFTATYDYEYNSANYPTSLIITRPAYTHNYTIEYYK